MLGKRSESIDQGFNAGDVVADGEGSENFLPIRDFGVVVSPEEWAEFGPKTPRDRAIQKGLRNGYYFYLKRYFGEYELGISERYRKIDPRRELKSVNQLVANHVERVNREKPDRPKQYLDELRDKYDQVSRFLMERAEGSNEENIEV